MGIYKYFSWIVGGYFLIAISVCYRFLHDVVTAVITERGVLTGLYSDTEMNSDNVKEKDAKVEYLTKLIDALSFSSGQWKFNFKRF